MARKFLTLASIAVAVLVSSSVHADIVDGLATQDLFLGATVARRASVDTNEFDIPDDQRPTGGSGIIVLSESFTVGPVSPGGTFFLPGTAAESTVTGISSTEFNSPNDISVQVLASSSLASIDQEAITGSYSGNAQAYSFFTFSVDETEEYSVFGTALPRSSTSDWQVRLSGGPAGFVFNRFTNPGSEAISFSGNVTLFSGFNYFLQSNAVTSASQSEGTANSSTFESVNFRFRPSAIPEPGSVGLLSIGALLFGVRRRKTT